MRKVFYCMLSVICILLFSISSVSAETLKIGVFDIQKIMQKSKVIEGYRQKFLNELESKKKTFREKENSVRQLEEKIKKGGQKLSYSEKRKLESELANELKELRRLKEDIDMELKKIDRELTQQALREIDGIIKKIASEENYTIIFEKNSAGIVHLKDSVDISDKIVTLYDKRL